MSRLGTRTYPIQREAEDLLGRFPGLKSKLFPSRLEHPNSAYCPDLFSPMTCPKRSYDGTELVATYRRIFPAFTFRSEADWERFETTQLFFIAVGTPDDWEDTYGEPFETRARVYAYVRPAQPEEMQFFSVEELTTSFLQEEDFVNPRSPRGQRLLFSPEQMNCFQALLEEREPDSPLRTIIQDLKSSRTRTLRQMRELSAQEHFRDCLSQMLHLAMLMRGWSGEGVYPLGSRTTGGEVDHYKLSCGLAALRARLESDWQHLRGIRLISYRGHTWIFEESRKTLYERLIPLMSDEICIRQTSAIFAWTVWYYMNEFFKEKPFPLAELEYIS